jgi:FkbM family methyltransferase
MTSIRATVFTKIGGVSARLPKIRGKNRAVLAVFNALGLRSQHLLVDTDLQRPIPYRARLDLHSWLQRLAFVSGEYEADTVELLIRLRRSVARSGYLLDVGANIGLIGVPAAMLLRQTSTMTNGLPEVICVEAVPDNQAALRLNISMNAAQDLVAVVGTALGEHPGVADIQVEGDLEVGQGTGTANILPSGSKLDPNGTYECVRIPVQVTTLDTLAQAGTIPRDCAVIKIDTDGYDLNILRGGRQFIASNRPVIFGEFSAHCLAWHHQSLDDVLAFARELDYKVWARLPGRRIVFSVDNPGTSYSQDLLLVPAESAGNFQWCLAGADQ